MLLTQWGRTGWDPFAEMRRVQSEMNRLFDAGETVRPALVYPPVNLWLGENSVVVTAELPGLSSDDVQVEIAEDALTIRGERTLAANDNAISWRRRERTTGPFSRTIELPFRVDADRVQARFADGVLEIEMQRPQADLPRRIQIKSS